MSWQRLPTSPLAWSSQSWVVDCLASASPVHYTPLLPLSTPSSQLTDQTNRSCNSAPPGELLIRGLWLDKGGGEGGSYYSNNICLLCVCMYVCMYVCVCVPVCMCMYAFMCVYVCIYVCICVFMFVYMCVCLYAWACLHVVHVHLHVNEFPYMYVYPHTCDVCICVCLCVHVLVCLCACARIKMHMPIQSGIRNTDGLLDHRRLLTHRWGTLTYPIFWLLAQNQASSPQMGYLKICMIMIFLSLNIHIISLI